MFVLFSEQVLEESKKCGMSITSVSLDMGYSYYTLPAAIKKKRFAIELMSNIADYFKKDVILHEGQFFMIERKERNEYC